MKLFGVNSVHVIKKIKAAKKINVTSNLRSDVLFKVHLMICITFTLK